MRRSLLHRRSKPRKARSPGRRSRGRMRYRQGFDPPDAGEALKRWVKMYAHRGFRGASLSHRARDAGEPAPRGDYARVTKLKIVTRGCGAVGAPAFRAPSFFRGPVWNANGRRRTRAPVKNTGDGARLLGCLKIESVMQAFPLMPAPAGIQCWVPAFAGTSGKRINAAPQSSR
jgi:hypothetical protein